MKTHKYVNGSCSTLKILCPQVKNLIQESQEKLRDYLEIFADPEEAHIGIKYLRYDHEYEEKDILKIVPKIKQTIENNLPIRIKILGLGGFWNCPEWPSKPIIFLKVEKTEELIAFHEEIRDKLRGQVDIFDLAEGRNYTPHITIGVGKNSDENILKKIVNNSKFKEPIDLVLDSFGMRTKITKTKIIN